MLAEPIKRSVKDAFDYHQKDNYYLQGSEGGRIHGKLAQELGYTDEYATDETFLQMLRGEDVTGKTVVKTKKQDMDAKGDRNVASTELMFASDKSVGLMYELALSKNPKIAAEIAKFHRESVQEVLNEIEAECMYSRTNEKAQSKALFVQYDHFEARPVTGEDGTKTIDPLLHSHVQWINVSQDVDGKFRALENFDMFKDYLHYGLQYRANLAAKLIAAGYGVEVVDAQKGFFSLKSIPSEVRAEFSKRHQQMEAAKELRAELEAKYPNAHKAQIDEMLKKKTREWKAEFNKSENIENNVQRLSKMGYKIDDLLHQIPNKPTLPPNKILNQAIEDLTEHKSVFTDKELKTQALKIGLDQGIVLADIKEAITNNIDLVRTRKGWTTREMIALESKNLAQKDSKSPDFIVSNTEETDTAIAEYQKRKGFELKRGQNDLVHAALNSDSQFIVAQGVAGAGKTTSLEVVKSVCDANGRNIIGLAPQATQAQNLEKESGIKSNTVASFLLNEELQASAKDSIIILDEAGMLGTRDMAKLFTIAQAQNAKLILSGDINQKKSISQGDAFKFLQENGFTTVTLDEGNRQKTNDLKIAVKHILNHDIASAIKTLQRSKNDEVTELTDRDERLLRAKEEYLEDPENSLLMARTNVDRRELNVIIRQELLAQGKITNSTTFSTREIPSMDNLEKRQSRYYQDGQTLYLSANIGKISAGREAKIISIDRENNTLVIEHEGQSKGKKTLIKETVNLSREGHNLNIYQDTKTDFGVNDTIIFKKPDKKLGLLNGHMGKITNIEGEKITALVNDKEVTFTTKQYPYIQHGYCVTDFAAQGKTIDHAIMLSDQVNYNDYYTQVTRAKQKVTVITSSIDNLIKSAARESVKLNALSEANISTVKKLKQIIKGYENGRIHRAIAESKDTARDYHRDSKITIADIGRTLKRFAKSSAEQWRQSALYRAFASDKGIKHELKELQKGINEVQNELQTKENTLTSKQGEERQMIIKPSKEPEVRQEAQEDDEEEQEGQRR